MRLAQFLLSTTIVGCVCTAGCTPMEPVRKLPLTMPLLVKDAVVLDVLFLRYPADDPELGEPLWKDVDELRLSQDARRRLTSNGIRAGVLNGTLPVALERRLQLTDKPAEESKSSGAKKVTDEEQPAVKRRQLRIQPGRRSNILAVGESERVAEMSLLRIGDDGRVQGRTYKQVLGLFAARAFPTGDAGARLELIPELEHGAAQKRFVPSDGMFKVEFGPPREVLTDLRITADLAPGEFLVLAAHPNREGSLGHRFFTEDSGNAPLRKLLLVRLAEADVDDRFRDDVAVPEAGEDYQTIDATVVTHER